MERSGDVAVKWVWGCERYHLRFMGYNMVHILHIADEMRFGEPLPSGWKHSS
jgi:hypothetical protein